MFGNSELSNLIDQAGTFQLTNGWRVVIRAEWTDETPQRPHGLSYAFILQNEKGDRLLGFDNSHAFDGAEANEPFDHEHRANRPHERVKYDFRSASTFLTDAFARCQAFCDTHSQAFEFEDDL